MVKKKRMLRLGSILTLLVTVVTALAQIRTADVAGNPVQLFEAGGSKPTVFIFVRTDCPIANRYAPEIERLYQAYAARAAFYLVYPDAGESRDLIHKHLTDYNYSLPALRDLNLALVKLAKVRVTPEAAIFSPGGQLLYHGRIDNRYVAAGRAMNAPTHRDLKEALETILAGKSVKGPNAPAIGCSLADIQ